jgi:hypothetical protein
MEVAADPGLRIQPDRALRYGCSHHRNRVRCRLLQAYCLRDHGCRHCPQEHGRVCNKLLGPAFGSARRALRSRHGRVRIDYRPNAVGGVVILLRQEAEAAHAEFRCA